MVSVSGLSMPGAARALRAHGAELGRRLERLSTGVRINGAGDDPAGAAISRRLEAEVRGKNQAVRNLNDGVSMLRTAESALQSVTDSLQRMRTLAVQAAQGTLTTSDRAALETEFLALADEIDDVAARATFNGKALLEGQTAATGLSAAESTIVEKLRSSWLAESESLISRYFGLTADGVSLTVTVDSIDGAYGTAAYVQGTIVPAEGTGFGNDLQLVIDVDDYAVFGDEYDAIIAHEMAHAVMYRSVNMYDTINGGVGSNTGTWFKEGTAELVAGADERVSGTLTRHSSSEIADRATELLGGAAWGGGGAHGFSTADDYTAGYVAVRYLHDRIQDAGGAGISDVFAYLSSNSGSGVDAALQALDAGAYAGGVADFAADWGGGAGLAYIDAMNLSNADTGALGGADADGGEVRDSADAVPDTYDYEVQPLAGFEVVWPLENEISLESTTTTTLQAGASSGSSIELSGQVVDRYTLGLDQISLMGEDTEAIGRVDRAIDLVSEAQAALGGDLSRLESAISFETASVESASAGRARIRDADYAAETTAFFRAQVLQRATTTLLAQGAGRREVLLTLLGA